MEAVIANSISHKVANIVIAVFALRLEMLVNHSAVHVNVQALILYHISTALNSSNNIIHSFLDKRGCSS